MFLIEYRPAARGLSVIVVYYDRLLLGRKQNVFVELVCVCVCIIRSTMQIYITRENWITHT